MSKVKPIPDGASALTPYLSCTNASEMIDFYKKGIRRDREVSADAARRPYWSRRDCDRWRIADARG